MKLSLLINLLYIIINLSTMELNAQTSEVYLGQYYNKWSSSDYKFYKENATKYLIGGIKTNLFQTGYHNDFRGYLSKKDRSLCKLYENELLNLAHHLENSLTDIPPFIFDEKTEKGYLLIQIYLERFRIISQYYYELHLIETEELKYNQIKNEELQHLIDSLNFVSNKIEYSINNKIKNNNIKRITNPIIDSLESVRKTKIDIINKEALKEVTPIAMELKAKIDAIKPEEYLKQQAILTNEYKQKILSIDVKYEEKKNNINAYYRYKKEPLYNQLKQVLELENEKLKKEIINNRILYKEKISTLSLNYKKSKNDQLSINKENTKLKYENELNLNNQEIDRIKLIKQKKSFKNFLKNFR